MKYSRRDAYLRHQTRCRAETVVLCSHGLENVQGFDYVGKHFASDPTRGFWDLYTLMDRLYCGRTLRLVWGRPGHLSPFIPSSTGPGGCSRSARPTFRYTAQVSRHRFGRPLLEGHESSGISRSHLVSQLHGAQRTYSRVLRK